jgi:hypothetical protein
MQSPGGIDKPQASAQMNYACSAGGQGGVEGASAAVVPSCGDCSELETDEFIIGGYVPDKTEELQNSAQDFSIIKGVYIETIVL